MQNRCGDQAPSGHTGKSQSHRLVKTAVASDSAALSPCPFLGSWAVWLKGTGASSLRTYHPVPPSIPRGQRTRAASLLSEAVCFLGGLGAWVRERVRMGDRQEAEVEYFPVQASQSPVCSLEFTFGAWGVHHKEQNSL